MFASQRGKNLNKENGICRSQSANVCSIFGNSEKLKYDSGTVL